MKGLFLSGYGCKSTIWDDFKNEYQNEEFVDWPTEQTPNFHKIDDFSNYLLKTYPIDNCDFIVGHSLGGLVALDLSRKIKVNKIVLVESFLVTPSKFFQNIVMENNLILKEKVMAMLKNEIKYYSQELGKNLRDLNLLDLLSQSKSHINVIYGDRGENETKAIQKLGLSKDILNKINIKIVHNSCHFPMLENPKDFKDVLNKIIK